MRRYLVVAHQTGDSPTLLTTVRSLAEADPAAEFVVLTPRRPITMTMVLGGESRSATQVALWRSRRTANRLRSAGAIVAATRLGGFDPMLAIEDELRSAPYDGVIISTLPHGLSAWLRLDLPARLKHRHPELDVIHVTTPSASFRDRPAPASRADGGTPQPANPRSA
jgi:hypothetical protein